MKEEEGGIWCTSQVEQGVIGKAVEVDVKFTEYFVTGQKVYDEEQGHHKRALRHTCSDWEWLDLNDENWVN